MAFTFDSQQSVPSAPRQIDPRTLKFLLAGAGAIILLVIIGLGIWSWQRGRDAVQELPSAQTPTDQQGNGAVVPGQGTNAPAPTEILIENPPEEVFDPATNRFLTAEEKTLYGFPAEWVVRMTVIKDGDVYRPQFERVQ